MRRTKSKILKKMIFFEVFQIKNFQKTIFKIFLSNSDHQTLVLGEHFGHDFLVKIRFQTFFLTFLAAHMRFLLRICGIY